MGIVAISRTVGSGGDAIAEALAERLDYRLIGRDELARRAAMVCGGAAAIRTPELGERAPTLREHLSQERRYYASLLRHAVLRLAVEDDVVVVGLGAGQMLRGLANVLSVKVVAPLADRVNRLVASAAGSLTVEQARDAIRRADHDASGYMRYLFRMDSMDSREWDVVINTGHTSADRALTMLGAYADAGYLTTTDGVRAHLANLLLASRVESLLLNQPDLWITGLRVKAEGDHVQVTGFVVTEDDREYAEQVIMAQPGVRTLENALGIHVPSLSEA